MERLGAGQRTAGGGGPSQSCPQSHVSVSKVRDPVQSNPITTVSTVGDGNIPNISELRSDIPSVSDQNMDLGKLSLSKN